MYVQIKHSLALLQDLIPTLGSIKYGTAQMQRRTRSRWTRE